MSSILLVLTFVELAVGLKPSSAPTGRREALSASLTAACFSNSYSLWAADSPSEAIRKAASNVPGLGPPDVLYPKVVFGGRFMLRREIASVSTPQGEDVASAASRFVLERSKAAVGARLEYPVRYIDYGDDANVVLDRAFAAEQAAKASPGDPFARAKARWEPSNPNVLVLETAEGGLLETKVTKRSFEVSPNTFGSSEYARLALLTPGGILGGIPDIIAQRTQTRWRWNDQLVNGPSIIEGIELTSTYDPKATGFGDLNGAQPVIITKSRLQLLRRSA